MFNYNENQIKQLITSPEFSLVENLLDELIDQHRRSANNADTPEHLMRRLAAIDALTEFRCYPNKTLKDIQKEKEYNV